MAIVQISRITARKGLQQDLPDPLAAAELGWSIDTRQLWIGNGTTEEGAPAWATLKFSLNIQTYFLTLTNTLTKVNPLVTWCKLAYL